MRRFTSKNHLVTLNEINITPLLDLAFVLLIIFVITTPALENSVDLKLPKGGKPPKTEVDVKNIRTIEVDKLGRGYRLNGTPMSLEQMGEKLSQEFKTNPNLVIRLRADRDGKYGWSVDVLSTCQKAGLTTFALQTEPDA